MSAPARPPEGRASSPGEGVAQRQEGTPTSAPARPPEGRASSRGEAAIAVLAVVGVGLIGGSFAAALRRAGYVGTVLGVGRNKASLERAQARGLIDRIVSAQEAAAQADMVMLACPVGTFGPILTEMRSRLKPGIVITDAGSTKVQVVEAARAALGDRAGCFVPGHPIAGAERVGPDAADPDLYTGRNVVLTPLAENASLDIDRVRAAWHACGAQVIDMAPDLHDQVLASVSHLPHFLAAVYVAQVARSTDSERRLSTAGSGFRDFTRIAAGSAEMWRDIFLSNRAAMLTELTSLRQVLDEAEHALREADGPALQELLEQAAQFRRDWKAGQ